MERNTFSSEIFEDVRILSKNFRLPFPIETMDIGTFAQLRCRNRKTPLHYSVFEGKHQMTRVLLENGADINAVDRFGSTPLHEACNSGKSLCAYIILDFKPDLNKQDSEFDTPLNKLVIWTFNFKRLLETFLDAGADPNIPDHFGFTPLHNVITYHVQSVALEYAQILIRYKANMNVKTIYEKTPLHLAVERNFHSVAEFLLENGASVNIEDQLGNTQMVSTLLLQNCGTKMAELLGMHVIKQYCCKIEVNQMHLELLIKRDGLREFKKECEKELLALKSRKLGKSNVTYYEILVSTPNKIGRYLRSCDISESLKETDINNYIFGDWLNRKYKEGLARYNALRIGHKFCRHIFHRLPHTKVILGKLMALLLLGEHFTKIGHYLL
ncbi:hypothetical protein WA026_014569 [Henosepilachna vigintioctopunctata]|uniref:Ankyrin repeat protein n=1 Tax=Henosepilachna vigintioctopunctata TaxID=420089 RepID=A0AAW1V6J8_9CUCU